MPQPNWNPPAATLAREALYICSPTGFQAYLCLSRVTDAELAQIKFERPVFKWVKRHPYVCPVNGAELGDEPFWVRVPHRSDGQELQLS
jgi:hypothetical protein